MVVVFSVTSCHKTAPIDPTSDPLKEHTQDLQQARTWLLGKWKLVKVSAMIPNPAVPAVELSIDENQISLIQGGIQRDKVDYEVVETTYGLLIKTNAQPREDNWYIRNPGLYINENRMFLDLGVATDGPGYEFVKVN